MTFDRPLDGFYLSNDDFELLSVAGDGSTTPAPGGSTELDESLDPDGYQIDLGLSRPLPLGRYELRLNSDGQIRGLDGSTLPGSALGSEVDDFKISSPTQGPNSATDLQVLGPNQLDVPGQLNLAGNPGAVQYYKFEVAPGHHWLVGLQVEGQTGGARFEASVSLFTASGRLISTANEGLAGDPGNPYLFADLDAGTYYVGVAAATNLPNASGVYDPATSNGNWAVAGGAFQLQAVADVQDQPTQVLGLRLDHADPLSASPSGLTLEFSGGIDPASLAAATVSGQSLLTLVDASGATWPLTPTGYDAGDGQLSFVFDRPVAPGTYSVELGWSDSLLDLAGQEPVSPGLPAGTLGTFTVAPSKTTTDDVGTVLPGLGGLGLGSIVQVTPGRATTETFAIVEPGVYDLGVTSFNGQARFSIEDGSGNVLTTSTGATAPNYLAAGSYQVVLTTTGSSPSAALFTIVQRASSNSSLLDTGVGQGSALALRLVTPQTNFGQLSGFTSTSSAATGSASAPGPAISSGLVARTVPGNGTATEAGSTGSVGQATTTIGSASGLVLGGGPVGRSSSPTLSIGVVGPSGPSGLATIASNSVDLLAGLVESSPAADQRGRSTDWDLLVSLESGLLGRPAESRREDDRSLADAERMGEFLAATIGRLAPAVAEAPADATGSLATIAEASAASIAPADERQDFAASVAPPLAFGAVVGAIVIGSRWKFFGKRTLQLPPKSGHPTHLTGPHRRRRVRVLGR